MSARFAILHHTGIGIEHWDLMLEHEGVLRTWQLPQEPHGPGALPLPARRIADHRTVYLNFEGPITGGRGIVRRVDEGTLEWLVADGPRLRFRLHGLRLQGTFALQEEAGGACLATDESDG